MFDIKKEKAEGPNCNGSLYAGSLRGVRFMEVKGSFTIEAAYILPVVLLCLFLPVWLGIDLFQEVKMNAEEIERAEVLDTVVCMYRKEWLDEILEVIKEGQ